MDNNNLKVDLNSYTKGDYNSQKGIVMRLVWYFINIIFFKSYLFPFYSFKRFLLKLFGAKIGKMVVIKPGVNIKYPWFLSIGDYTWIGEGVWIDNLTHVKIGSHVCISQGALLLTGNHNYKKISFDLIIGEIELKEGVWIGAKSLVCLNVKCETHSVLSAGSLANHDLEAYGIYQGNPAVKIKNRIIEK
jgi:putative colanic acid biosynthesis acetyltransferase WcaF